MHYKNWPAICAEPNDSLRRFVSLSEDPRILEGLAKGFPELFTENKSNFPVPLSVLQEYARPYGWGQSLSVALTHFGIPVSYTFINVEEVDGEIGEEGSWYSLEGYLVPGYENANYIAIDYFSKVSTKDMKGMDIGDSFSYEGANLVLCCRDPNHYAFQFAPLECIDVTK